MLRLGPILSKLRPTLPTTLSQVVHDVVAGQLYDLPPPVELAALTR